MSKRVETTSATGELLRHGILHGRELAYDTHVNSTKAWAALFAIIDGVKKRAEVLNNSPVRPTGRLLSPPRGWDEEGLGLTRSRTGRGTQGYISASTFSA